MEEKDYGGNCHLYDHEKPDDPYHNIKVGTWQIFIKKLIENNSCSSCFLTLVCYLSSYFVLNINLRQWLPPHKSFISLDNLITVSSASAGLPQQLECFSGQARPFCTAPLLWMVDEDTAAAWLVVVLGDICYVWAPWVHFGTPASQFFWVLVGSCK